MDYTTRNPVSLSLRGKNISDLREMASNFCSRTGAEVAGMDRSSLIEILSCAASENKKLANEIGKSGISIKSSFYLMILSLRGQPRVSARALQQQLNREFRRSGAAHLRPSKVPAYRLFTAHEVRTREGYGTEVHFTWERARWYWQPSDVSLAHVYELRFGLAILDFTSHKAVIACQTTHERHALAGALSRVLPVSFSPIALTKPILNQIGTFEHVKRAGYFIADPDPRIPSNITYADDNLAARPLAREEEDNPRSQRKHSFYMIPLGSVVEQGVGATSDSGKLWIPRQVPLNTVREYAIDLLGKIGRTLDDMTRQEEYAEVLAALGIPHLPRISSIGESALRNQVCLLLEEIVNMIVRRQTERPFSLAETLAIDGVPSLFNHPRLQLTDPLSGESSWWVNPDKSSQLVRVVRSHGHISLAGHPGKETIDLGHVKHPITGSNIQIDDPLSALDLTPTLGLHEMLLEAITHISDQIPQLRAVHFLPFRISAGRIQLDVDRCLGRSGMSTIGVTLFPEEIAELQRPLRRSIPSSRRSEVEARLRDLGEKCVHMSDAECPLCVFNSKYICLRSLVARNLRNARLLAHKGIELSDLQAAATYGEPRQTIDIFGFTKLASGRSGLTARNSNGAILLAHVLGQLDKSGFDTALVVSPSTINQDLHDRLRLVCGVFGKRLLVLDQDSLSRLLLHFEEQASFDRLNARAMYRSSQKRDVQRPRTRRLTKDRPTSAKS